MPYQSIYEKIKKTGKANAYSVSRFGSNKIRTFNELKNEIERLCATSERKYVYGYWEYPDSLMHKFGCYNSRVTENIKDLEEKVTDLCERLSDTLVLVTADHGHCNLSYYILSDYPKLFRMLKRPTSIETRATAFYIKDEYLDEFPNAFKHNFGDDFLLYSKEEVIEKNIFGFGTMNARFEELIGDYLAIAIRDKGIVYSHKSKQFVSNHAGLTEQEMKIPLIAICKK